MVSWLKWISSINMGRMKMKMSGNEITSSGPEIHFSLIKEINENRCRLSIAQIATDSWLVRWARCCVSFVGMALALWPRTAKNLGVGTGPLVCLLIRLFARTAKSIACSALLASLARSTGLIYLLARSLTSSWESEWLDGFYCYVFFCSRP